MKRACELDPDNVTYITELATQQLRQLKYADAIASFNKVLENEKDKNNATAWLGKLECLVFQNNSAKVEADTFFESLSGELEKVVRQMPVCFSSYIMYSIKYDKIMIFSSIVFIFYQRGIHLLKRNMKKKNG